MHRESWHSPVPLEPLVHEGDDPLLDECEGVPRLQVQPPVQVGEDLGAHIGHAVPWVGGGVYYQGLLAGQGGLGVAAQEY